jgi:hypothetical protein
LRQPLFFRRGLLCGYPRRGAEKHQRKYIVHHVVVDILHTISPSLALLVLTSLLGYT